MVSLEATIRAEGQGCVNAARHLSPCLKPLSQQCFPSVQLHLRHLRCLGVKCYDDCLWEAFWARDSGGELHSLLIWGTFPEHLPGWYKQAVIVRFLLNAQPLARHGEVLSPCPVCAWVADAQHLFSGR